LINPLKIKRNNKIFSFSLIAFFVSASFLFLGNIAHAAEWKWYDIAPMILAYRHGGEIASCGLHPITCILSFMLGVVGIFLGIALTFFAWIIDAETITSILKADAILKTWGLVRDICNIGFILILLFSAFATVFQYSKYNYKNILMWLVIMALLINFSYPITLFVIDLSNSFMYTILKVQFSTITDGNAANILMEGNGTFTALQNYIKAANSHSDTTELFFMVIFIFILAFTIFALGLILLIRVIALAIIIITSPFGFIGKVISSDGGWWNKLFTYAMAGPIIAIVLLISMRLMNAILSSADFTALKKDNFVAHSVELTIPIVILWMGIAMAVKGIEGAGTVLGKTQGIAKWAGAKFSGYNRAKWFATKAVPGMVNAGWETFEEGVLAKRGLSPTAFVEGWKQRSKTKRDEKISVATGAWRDKLNKWKSFGKYKTNFEELAEDRLDANRIKELKESSSNANYLLSQGAKLVGTKSDDAIRDWKAIGTILYTNRDQDELMGFIRNNYDEKILPKGRSFADIGIKKDELGVSGWNANNAMRKILSESGASKEDIDDYLMDIGEIAAGNKGVGYGGSDYNTDGAVIGAADRWQQARTAVAKMNTVDEVQGLARGLHRNNITSELEAKKDASGNDIVSGIDVTKEEFEKLSGEAYTVINPEFDELVRVGTLGNIKEHVARHNPSFYQRVGDEKTIRGMKNRIKDLVDKGGERWDPTANNGKGATVKGVTISAEQARVATEWVDALENFAKNGKKK
jgi:hypothetical protein